MEALGMIGIRGLAVPIETSDVTVKVACVKLVGIKQIGGGLVIAMVRGNVVACKAATDAEVAAAQRIGELVSVHVIPRPHGDLEEVFPISFKGDSNIQRGRGRREVRAGRDVRASLSGHERV